MASLSASALSQRSKSPELTIAATPRGFGSSGRGVPGGSGAGASTSMSSRPTRRCWPAMGPNPADPAGVRLGEQAPEVAILRAIGVLEQQRGRDPLEYLGEPALVVARLVGGDHEVEPAHAGGTQQAVDARLGRASVEQRGGPCAVLDQGGIALTDVEEADGEGVGRRRAWRAPRPRQAPAKPRRARQLRHVASADFAARRLRARAHRGARAARNPLDRASRGA